MRPLWSVLLCLLSMAPGCGESSAPPDEGGGDSAALSQPEIPTAPPVAVSPEPGAMTIRELREALGIGAAGEIRKVGGEVRYVDLQGTGVSDLSPLKGLLVEQLFLEETPVSDLSPLAGMPLDVLYLSQTQVSDLAPLKGMDLAELNLVGTPVRDLTPLKEVGLGTLWIPETQVSDLSPLAGKSFVSLDIRDTPVSDLTPLSGNTSLRRLHIAGTNVTDLTPLAGLQLERLIFTPGRIEKGMDVIRDMQSLQGLDTHFEGGDVMRPEEFWNLYEAGDLEE